MKSCLRALIVVSMMFGPAIAAERSPADPAGPGPKMNLPANGSSSPTSLRAPMPASQEGFKGNKPTTQQDRPCQQRVHQHQPMGC